MELNQIIIIISASLGGLLLLALAMLFFVSRRSQKVMGSLLNLLNKPERAKITDAARVLQALLADEIVKIEYSFQTMRKTLDSQIASANELNQHLTVQNDVLVSAAEGAVKKVANTSQRLENTVLGLSNIVESAEWHNITSITEGFNAVVNDLLGQIKSTADDVQAEVASIQNSISGWTDTADILSEKLTTGFQAGENQMKGFSVQADELQGKLAALTKSASDGFEQVKVSASNYESVMLENDKLLKSHLQKMTEFSKLTKKQLTDQMNSLTNTANVVAGQVCLTESSVEKQIKKLAAAVELVINSATETETHVSSITENLAGLTNNFNKEVKGFATDVVAELKTVSGVANVTLENTKTSANAFSDSVKAMATGVRETLIKMNTAHKQLSGQSENLIKMSKETTDQLKPLSELIEKYFLALPDLSKNSVDVSDNLNKIVMSLQDKIMLMKTSVSESTDTISESAIKLEDLAGTSRQQMIDLMADYAKAVNTMQTLNKQMMVARATAPMDAINNSGAAAMPQSGFARVSSQDFVAQAEKALSKLHEQSLDLTRATGADIPDKIWTAYHSGDTAIFSKWLAKILLAANKKQVRDMLKSDSVFKSQAVQFVRSFEKIVAGVSQTDNANAAMSALGKTDLGQIYNVLKSLV